MKIKLIILAFISTFLLSCNLKEDIGDPIQTAVDCASCAIGTLGSSGDVEKLQEKIENLENRLIRIASELGKAQRSNSQLLAQVSTLEAEVDSLVDAGNVRARNFWEMYEN